MLETGGGTTLSLRGVCRGMLWEARRSALKGGGMYSRWGSETTDKGAKDTDSVEGDILTWTAIHSGVKHGRS